MFKGHHQSTIILKYIYIIMFAGIVILKNNFLSLFNVQSLAKHSRSNIGAEGGPPPFVPFGQVRLAVYAMT